MYQHHPYILQQQEVSTMGTIVATVGGTMTTVAGGSNTIPLDTWSIEVSLADSSDSEDAVDSCILGIATLGIATPAILLRAR